MATKGAIMPAAVGVDIGCGMIAVKTNLKREAITDLPKLRAGIERRVPMSAGRFNNRVEGSAKARCTMLEDMPGIETANKLSPNWREQLGTLGGGNHFIEVCIDLENTIWVTLHSGSRGVGNRIGNHYIKEAQGYCERSKIELPNKDLAYLAQECEEFPNYMRDLQWAQEFARLNRAEMMDRVMAELADNVLNDHSKAKELEVERINCHHNFTQWENHHGEDLMITRKGAIEAREGMRGMIPGSMGTRSYIVTGKANPESMNSAPHGAGRQFSRTKAKEKFTMEDFDKAMAGIEHRRDEGLIDELPQAYKDIDVVMENAKELVAVETILKQILNCKGD